MAQAGQNILVEVAADVQHRCLWKINHSYLDPFKIIFEPDRQVRHRYYQTWECRTFDEPISGQAAATPTGYQLETYENSSQYDQGRLIYVHRDVFVQPSFSAWATAIPAGTPDDTISSMLVDHSADLEHRFFWTFSNPEDDPFTIIYEPIRQTRERPRQIWESRVIDTPYWGQVAATPAGYQLTHWENVCEYDQGTLVYVHRDTFTTPDFTAWTPEITP